MQNNWLFNPLHDPFYPIRLTDQTIQQVPLTTLLLGEWGEYQATDFTPAHPDPTIRAFLRYLPSLFLQALSIELEQDSWIDLVLNGNQADSFSHYQDTVTKAIQEKSDFFNLYSDKNGFYQHIEVREEVKQKKKGSKLVHGMDGLLLHATTGNNHCHHRQPNAFHKMCLPCALTTLIHHNNYCPAGLAGPSNIRGNQAYLCLIHKKDPVQRLLANCFFPGLDDDHTIAEKCFWQASSSADKPSWQSPGTRVTKGFEDQDMAKIGLKRALFYTPRHAFFDITTEHDNCDFCGLAQECFVTQYYWRIGDKLTTFVGHPALAIYQDNKQQILPQNFNPSVWRELGGLVIPDHQSNNKTCLPAPLVQQYNHLLQDEGKSRGRYTLELHAYETDKAKLLGFHEQHITLPRFPDSQKKLKGKFYDGFQNYAETIRQMLSSFLHNGKADKKRSKEEIPNITSAHQVMTESIGKAVLNDIITFHRQLTSDDFKPIYTAMAEQLTHYSKKITTTFEQLCEPFSFEDYQAQQRLLQQRRFLNTHLRKLIKAFQDTHQGKDQ